MICSGELSGFAGIVLTFVWFGVNVVFVFPANIIAISLGPRYYLSQFLPLWIYYWLWCVLSACSLASENTMPKLTIATRFGF
jgi:hypothetical protein